MVFDHEQLHKDIRSFLTSDPIASAQLPTPTQPRWSLDSDGFLCLDGRIYVPDSSNL